MPSFLTNTAGGKSIATMKAPRSRRGDTNQVASYWAGGGATPLEVQYLVVGGGGGGAGYSTGVAFGSGGDGGQWKSSTIGENSGGCSAAQAVFAPALGTNYSVTRGGGGAGSASAYVNPGSTGSSSSFATVSSSGGAGGISTPLALSGSNSTGGISCGNTTNIRGSVETYGIGGSYYGYGAAAAGGSNTGNGGQGGGGPGHPGSDPGASGGSGIVILKYPDAYTITIGAGLTGSTAGPSNGFKVTTITAGTGNVSWV
jgi:hypothetical protein